MREHGTHACFVHGPNPGTVKGGCGCQPCRDANAAYERERSRRQAPPYVDATEAREHMAALSEAGVGLKQVAKVSGVSTGCLWKLVFGKPGRGPSKRIRPGTAGAILAVNVADHAADGTKIDSTACRRDLLTLLERGWSKSAISKEIGQGGRALQVACLRDPRAQVNAGTARRIRALLDQPVQTKRTRSGRALPPAWEREQAIRDEARRAVDAERQREYRQAKKAAEQEWTEIEAAPSPLSLAVFDEPWRQRAACRFVADHERWVFWPAANDADAIAAAKTICATCPVAGPCLEQAMAAREFGVWGGELLEDGNPVRQAVA